MKNKVCLLTKPKQRTNMIRKENHKMSFKIKIQVNNYNKQT